jgi:hypothetical protein
MSIHFGPLLLSPLLLLLRQAARKIHTELLRLLGRPMMLEAMSIVRIVKIR